MFRKGLMRKHSGETLEEGSFLDLGTMHFDDEDFILSGAKSTVRVAELFRFEDLHSFAKYAYNGDILILDYTTIATDQVAMRRLGTELKNIATDLKGDVAGVAKNMLMLTPSGVRIDRNKLRPNMF